ncbi:MAG TPA: hypothetical protein VKP03_00950 [Patescibacteria group bacterium]|nr:hypothetical protein [Patescibacteria group bacterium]
MKKRIEQRQQIEEKTQKANSVLNTLFQRSSVFRAFLNTKLEKTQEGQVIIIEQGLEMFLIQSCSPGTVKLLSITPLNEKGQVSFFEKRLQIAERLCQPEEAAKLLLKS